MTANENDFLDIDTTGGANGEYVPKFERDLQSSGGSLSKLSQIKKAQKEGGADPAPAKTAAEMFGTEAPDDVREFNIEVDESTLPAAETAPEPEPQPQVPSYDEADIDFVYGEDENYNYSGKLEDIRTEDIALDEMDVKLEDMRTEKSMIVSSLKNQMQQDDLAMAVKNRPKLDEMSDEYTPSQKKNSDLAAKEQLDREEKELIKTRLKSEIESKPEGYDKKKSLEMYKKLMSEQRARESKHGFVILLLVALMGIAAAVLVFFLAPYKDTDIPVLEYLPVATAAFSLLMVVKSKFFKIMSVLFFVAETAVLIYPCLVGFIATTADSSDLGVDFLIRAGMYVAAVVLCALTFVKLAANKDIELYYSYRPDSGKGRGRR